MSDFEALMWTLEKDPALSATFASVTILDQVPDFERFRRRMVRAVNRIPRLRQRVVPGGLGRLAPPEWQDDPSFDIDYHVSRMALAAPGTERELLDLATRLAQDPFDRTRPLWEFHIVEGLEGGRAALFQKMHHTITDGEGGIRLSERFVDAERHPGELPRRGGEALSLSKALVKQLTPTDGSKSPLWHERTQRRRMRSSRCPSTRPTAAPRRSG